MSANPPGSGVGSVHSVAADTMAASAAAAQNAALVVLFLIVFPFRGVINPSTMNSVLKVQRSEKISGFSRTRRFSNENHLRDAWCVPYFEKGKHDESRTGIGTRC